MTRDERFEGITQWFMANRGDAASELDFASPYQLLAAVMLSAQCTDKRVNMVTPSLFEEYPDARHLAGAEVGDVVEIIKSVSYPNAKARHLVETAKKLCADFGGEVPSSPEDLQSLPGVGRKTACVVASICFDAPVIAVDTHVFRVSRRIGLSRGSTPEAVEKDLGRGFAGELRPRAHHWLILHGRYVCTARAPKCGSCPIREWCREYGSKKTATGK